MIERCITNQTQTHVSQHMWVFIFGHLNNILRKTYSKREDFLKIFGYNDSSLIWPRNVTFYLVILIQFNVKAHIWPDLSFLLLRLFLPIIGHSKWLTAKKNGICSSFSSTPFKGGVVTISLELFQKRDRQGKREKIPYNNRTKRTTNLFAKKDATKGCPTLWVKN